MLHISYQSKKKCFKNISLTIGMDRKQFKHKQRLGYVIHLIQWLIIHGYVGDIVKDFSGSQGLTASLRVP
jgi:hypothetical protein